MPVNKLARGLGRCIAAFVAWIAIWSGSAHAVVMQSTDSFSGAGASTQTLTLDLFDPTLGDLTQVDLWIEFGGGYIATTSPEYVFCFGSTCPKTVTTGGSVTRSVGFSRGTIGIQLSETNTEYNSCTATSSEPDKFCGPYFLFGFPLHDGDSATDNATLALFTGPGTFSIDFIISENGDWTPRVSGAATVTYTYREAVTTVPEPTTLALVGLGLAGIGYGRRCSKKTA